MTVALADYSFSTLLVVRCYLKVLLIRLLLQCVMFWWQQWWYSDSDTVVISDGWWLRWWQRWLRWYAVMTMMVALTMVIAMIVMIKIIVMMAGINKNLHNTSEDKIPSHPFMSKVLKMNCSLKIILNHKINDYIRGRNGFKKQKQNKKVNVIIEVSFQSHDWGKCRLGKFLADTGFSLHITVATCQMHCAPAAVHSKQQNIVCSLLLLFALICPLSAFQ